VGRGAVQPQGLSGCVLEKPRHIGPPPNLRRNGAGRDAGRRNAQRRAVTRAPPVTASRLSATVGAGWICSRPLFCEGVRDQPLDLPHRAEPLG